MKWALDPRISVCTSEQIEDTFVVDDEMDLDGCVLEILDGRNDNK